MRLRRRLLVFVAVQGIAVALIPVVAGFATTGETVHAVGGGIYTPYWSPSSASTTPGGSVNFENASGYSHGIVWHSLPVGASAPVCGGSVPVYAAVGEGGGTSWSGSCSFAHSGAYEFYCSVHGAAMKGTITVQSPSTPKAVTDPQSEVTQTTATLNGTVHPEGTATSYYFAWGTTSAMTEKIPLTPQSVGADFAEHAVSAPLTNLQPGTEYHFKLVATYGTNEKAEGLERVFTTLPPAVSPTATTGKATAHETEAMLEGIVNPGWDTTKYLFEYGTTATYGQLSESKSLAAGGSAQTVTLAVTKLIPSTTYHYRLFAENGQGHKEGMDGTFTTTSPPVKEPTKEPAKETTPSPTPSTPVIASALPKPEEKLVTLGPVIAAGSLKLSEPRHGSSVHGSLDVAQAGAGGTLEVDLLAKTASLAKARHKKSTSTVVGRLVRDSVSAGKVAFSVGLSVRARSALRRHHKLALTVRITLTPPSGHAEVVTRSVVLHG